METKQCSACLVLYELSRKNFHRDNGSSSGFGSRCKDCVNNNKKSARQKLAKEEGKRQCPSCGDIYPLTTKFFNKDNSKLLGFENLCKLCRKEKKIISNKNRTRSNQCGSLNEKKHNSLKGYVYILNSNGFYKIGATTNKFTLNERIKKLQCGNPYQITIKHLIKTFDMMGLEEKLHEVYKYQNIRGERFSLSDDQLNYLMGLSSKKHNYTIDISIKQA